MGTEIAEVYQEKDFLKRDTERKRKIYTDQNMGRARKLAFYSSILRNSDHKTIKRHLPEIEKFRKELIDGFNKFTDMKSELWFALIDALENSYGKHWGLYFNLIRLPSNEKQGIAYVKTPHTFKESIDWVVSSKGLPTDRFKLTEPAKAYKRWHEIREGLEPVATFDSISDILKYKKFSGLQFLVVPGVEIDGTKDSLSLQNWFGNDHSFWTGQEVRNPYWDT